MEASRETVIMSDRSDLSRHCKTASFRDASNVRESKSDLTAGRPPAGVNLKVQESADRSTATMKISEPSTSQVKRNKLVKSHNLAFRDIEYRVKSGLLRSEMKTVLDGLCGEFKSGDLTAVIGPSGAGKSTLLNVLSGYTTQNIRGEVSVNGIARDLKTFYPQSAYIMQDTTFQSFLTVMEAMNFSVNLKIGNRLSRSAKKERIKTVLEAIGMYETRSTDSGNLSGGQRKRLSIALELVTNPPILFLDEPTSGLDSSSSTQCISLLKKLADEGRTIICTIHQPSALMIGIFDHLFAMADGQCIYSGSTSNVVEFLSELNLKCPESYNPADYLLEIATNEYGPQNARLVHKIENGRNDMYRKYAGCITSQLQGKDQVERMMVAELMTKTIANATDLKNSVNLAVPKVVSSSKLGANDNAETCLKECGSINVKSKDSPQNKKNKKKKLSLQIDPSKLCQYESRYMSSFSNQLILLLKRTFLILWRDKSLTRTRIFLHALMGTFVGTLYYGIGNDASNMLNNFRYIFFSIMFVMYTAFSSITLNFPLEFPIVSREHFNRWYSLRAYYVALTVADLPIQTVCTVIYVMISYFMTNQPLEITRMALFFGMLMMASLVAQSIGLVVGTTFNLVNGAIFGPFFICPFLIFSGFFVQIRDVHETMHWVFHISFLKYALEGSSLAIFGYGRPKMDCNEIFCQYIRPHRFLKVIGMDNGSYLVASGALTCIYLLLRCLSFYIMSHKLRKGR